MLYTSKIRMSLTRTSGYRDAFALQQLMRGESLPLIPLRDRFGRTWRILANAGAQSLDYHDHRMIFRVRFTLYGSRVRDREVSVAHITTPKMPQSLSRLRSNHSPASQGRVCKEH